MFRRYLFLLFLVTLAFAPLCLAPFVYDDGVAIEGNQWLRSPIGFAKFFSGHVDPERDLAGAFRPLFLSWLALWGNLIGFSALALRALSFLLHACVGLLVYKWGRSLLGLEKGFSLLAAAIFLVHPVQVTNLGLIWKQSDLWIALFALGSTLVLAKSGSSLRRPVRFLATYLLFVLALLFKESAMIIPLIWLAMEGLFPRKGRPIRLGLVGLGIITSFCFYHFVWLGIERPAIADGNPSGSLLYFATQLKVYPYYLKALFFPSALTIDRGISLAAFVGFLSWVLLVGAALLGLFLFFLAIGRRSSSAALALVGGIWLVPTSTLHPLSLIYDETRLYLVVAMLALALARGLQTLPSPRFLVPPWNRWLGVLGIGLLIVLSFFETFRWQSERALWEAALEVATHTPRAHFQLGVLAQDERALDEAEARYREALRQSGSLPNARLNLGIVLGQKGDLAGAAQQFQHLLGEDPFWAARGHYHLALGAMYQQNHGEARRRFEEVEKIDPKLAAKGESLLQLAQEGTLR